MSEFRRSIELHSAILSLPVTSSMAKATTWETHTQSNHNSLVIKGITKPIKLVISCIILLPRVLLTGFLLWLGCMWLAATNDFSDLVLNGVALEFMMWLKNFLGQASMSARSKQELRSIIILPPS